MLCYLCYLHVLLLFPVLFCSNVRSPLPVLVFAVTLTVCPSLIVSTCASLPCYVYLVLVFLSLMCHDHKPGFCQIWIKLFLPLCVFCFVMFCYLSLCSLCGHLERLILCFSFLSIFFFCYSFFTQGWVVFAPLLSSVLWFCLFFPHHSRDIWRNAHPAVWILQVKLLGVLCPLQRRHRMDRDNDEMGRRT